MKMLATEAAGLKLSCVVSAVADGVKTVRACLKIHFMLLTVEYEPIV